MMDIFHIDAKKQLKQVGLKLTQPRILVLATLLSCDEPLTHQQLEKKLKTIDRVTLYRVLECLIEHDLAHKLSGADRVWRFEACSHRKAHKMHHIHPHFHCDICQRFICLGNNAEFHMLHMQLALPEGFEGKSMDVTINGLCDGCNHQETTL